MYMPFFAKNSAFKGTHCSFSQYLCTRNAERTRKCCISETGECTGQVVVKYWLIPARKCSILKMDKSYEMRKNSKKNGICLHMSQKSSTFAGVFANDK